MTQPLDVPNVLREGFANALLRVVNETEALLHAYGVTRADLQSSLYVSTMLGILFPIAKAKGVNKETLREVFETLLALAYDGEPGEAPPHAITGSGGDA